MFTRHFKGADARRIVASGARGPTPSSPGQLPVLSVPALRGPRARV